MGRRRSPPHRVDLRRDQNGKAKRAHETAGDLPFGPRVGIHLTKVQAVFERSKDAPIDGPGWDCYDNALAESFFASIKKECTNHTAFPTVDHLRKCVAEYIELWYNRERLHSALNYQTPSEVREAYQKPVAA